MSLIGQVVRIFDLFYMPSLILRTQIANTKIFKYFLENLKEKKKKKLNLICCWQMCMTWQSVFVTNHISNTAMYVYVAWYFSENYLLTLCSFCLFCDIFLISVCLILKSQLFRSFTSVYLFGKLWNPVWPYTQNLLYYTKHWILFFCLENLKGALPKMFNISWVFALLLFWLHFSHNT